MRGGEEGEAEKEAGRVRSQGGGFGMDSVLSHKVGCDTNIKRGQQSYICADWKSISSFIYSLHVYKRNPPFTVTKTIDA